MKECRKSVHICQSYYQTSSGFLFGTQCTYQKSRLILATRRRFTHNIAISGVTTNSAPPAKAAKHGHSLPPLPAIEQFEVNCAASISKTMHSLQLCREIFFWGGGGTRAPFPDPRGPPCVAGSAGAVVTSLIAINQC